MLPPGIRTMLKALQLSFFLFFATQANAGLDLSKWDNLLKGAVDKGFVDYTQWRDNALFNQLVDQIATADTTTMNAEQQLVFYINAYNILAARGILNNHSPATLFGRWGYFKRDQYIVAGETINLYDLEHSRIRPLGEPRIHFAIVCASQSCPVLRSEAYTLDKLNEQLDDAARNFVNDPSRNIFDADAGIARLSKIFSWFEADFVSEDRPLQLYLADYVEDPATASLLYQQRFEIKYLNYDWDLNGIK